MRPRSSAASAGAGVPTTATAIAPVVPRFVGTGQRIQGHSKRFTPYAELDATLRAMGIKPNKRRRAALLSWNLLTMEEVRPSKGRVNQEIDLRYLVSVARGRGARIGAER